MTSEEFTNGHPALARFWHPVALSSEVGRKPAAARLGGRGWALARFGGGIAAFADACPHRRARLSAGQITGGTLQCPYHGWQFTPDGRCVNIPAVTTIITSGISLLTNYLSWPVSIKNHILKSDTKDQSGYLNVAGRFFSILKWANQAGA